MIIISTMLVGKMFTSELGLSVPDPSPCKSSRVDAPEIRDPDAMHSLSYANEVWMLWISILIDVALEVSLYPHLLYLRTLILRKIIAQDLDILSTLTSY